MSSLSPTQLISVDGLEVRRGNKVLLHDIDLTVSEREIVTVIGPNGGGKSTLVRAVLGLIQPTAGSVSIRRGITVGYMPQRLHIEPHLPISVRRFVGLSGPVVKGGRHAVLDEVGVSHIAGSSIHDISGGEMQRVLLARALLRDPDLLVLDEPAQAVDVSGQADLYNLIARLRDDHGCGVLMVSHDLHLVMSATDNIICINTHLCCAGHPETVSQDPSYVELFGPQVAASVALYHHRHDHTHSVDGHVIDADHG